MMPVRFREEAERDLRGIVAWYEEIAPEALANILAAIFRSIDRLSAFPRLGMRVEDRTFRRIVTRKYHFKIVYEVANGSIVVLGIFRHQDRTV